MSDRPRCITMDPPWAEYGGGGRGAQNHYMLLDRTGIAKTILRAPVWRPADDCHLWMWVTNNYLVDGISLMDQLGFRYVSNFVWVKVRDVPDHDATAAELEALEAAAAQEALQKGLGQYLRHSHELCLFGTRGDAMVPPPERRPPSVLFAPRGRHSAKPEEAYDIFEKVSPGPRLEMFARGRRPGWEAWGNEAPADNRIEVAGDSHR
jgi:N6-adenosine-specific RNA methylase IME4